MTSLSLSSLPSSKMMILLFCLFASCWTRALSFVVPPTTTTRTTITTNTVGSHYHHRQRLLGKAGLAFGNHASGPFSQTTTSTTTTTLTTLHMANTNNENNNKVRRDNSENKDNILPASIAVGAITAGMGFLYGKVLGVCVHTLWRTLPAALVKRGSRAAAVVPYFIPAMCTAGGLLMGLLSAKFQTSTFTVADFVSAFSATKTQALPSSRSYLLPLLLLSLVTSTFGFSVGPEAPMVCAGGLVGASLARQWYGSSKSDDIDANDDSNFNQQQALQSKAESLAYAGAAGALTAFMGIPIAGSIFALELTRSGAGLSSSAKDALSPAVAASVAGLVLIRALLLPNVAVGGHFTYGPVGTLSGRAMMMAALAASVMGALLGTVFHKGVAFLKGKLWPYYPTKKEETTTTSSTSETKPWKREVLVKTIIGLIVGLLSAKFPQTLFWGEGSLQCVVDGQKTAFAATKHGLPTILTSAAKIDPNLPFASATAALQVGLVKLLAIALACAGKFPGGIIFPLFFAAAPIAHACRAWVAPSVLPVLVLCTMAATQASVTRTPLATALILSLSASASTELSAMLPACLVASYFGVYLSQLISRNSYFKYSAE